jgi:HAD superfamily phosphatase (TIGR01668 family)
MFKFQDLDIKKLKNFVIFLDIDGTIVAHNKDNTSSKIKKKINQLKKNNKLYFCSNNHNKLRNERLSRELNIPIINKSYKKPNKKILAFLPAQEKKQPLLVIGDKTFPDGIFAKRIEAKFIKISRIVSEKESLIVRLIYWLDKFFK